MAPTAVYLSLLVLVVGAGCYRPHENQPMYERSDYSGSPDYGLESEDGDYGHQNYHPKYVDEDEPALEKGNDMYNRDGFSNSSKGTKAELMNRASIDQYETKTRENHEFRKPYKNGEFGDSRPDKETRDDDGEEKEEDGGKNKHRLDPEYVEPRHPHGGHHKGHGSHRELPYHHQRKHSPQTP
ncbi:hypothetical protein L9F63_024125 [Diploptera punctata]|uniref:Uncharacterized protein n=1 Tax=Diploptera punctata TaxID=6984 RepID=A0AAD7ZIG2_DIPPU|nr:hypothetical protein L9F63_024125 [Diploptera punctata]